MNFLIFIKNRLQIATLRLNNTWPILKTEAMDNRWINPASQPSATSSRLMPEPILHRITGADLTKVDGLDSLTVLKIISEIGLDMNRWTTVKHFASWMGLSPGSKISGGKVLSAKTKKCANRAAHYLRLSAYSLHSSKSAIGTFFRRKKAHLGPAKAITTTAHKLARIII